MFDSPDVYAPSLMSMRVLRSLPALRFLNKGEAITTSGFEAFREASREIQDSFLFAGVFSDEQKSLIEADAQQAIEHASGLYSSYPSAAPLRSVVWARSPLHLIYMLDSSGYGLGGQTPPLISISQPFSVLVNLILKNPCSSFEEG
jgi:hypothetical protein